MRLAAAALDDIRRGDAPADAVMRELFARHRNAGARDRAQISELVYGVLRRWFPLQAVLGPDAPSRALCDALVEGRRVEGAGDDATRHNLPTWLWNALQAQYGADASPLALALNEAATVDLRVNTLKATPAAAQAALAAENIVATPIPQVATGLRLARREPLQRTAAFRDGWVEPQDAGSQRLVELVAARPGERVVDFCAGAGGKTLALGAAMKNRGELHALDVSRARLARLEPRLARSGLSIVRAHAIRHELDPRLQPLAGRCDAVLVDAPCSATGTLRRNPELRLRTPDLGALASRQRAILDGAAALVKPGGRLVYATCSVLREENEEVVDGFLAAHPDFREDARLVLLPHRDHTDAFFATRLLKGVGVD